MVVKKGEAEKAKERDFPTVKEVINQAAAAGVESWVCKQSTQLLNLNRGEFFKGSQGYGRCYSVKLP
jgi:predicted peroxiredoxin